ncbi:MAG: hypothetical protein LBQ12_15485 [Deltaproteobacteria bacterium]|nr:hypothetical protein [Deltaproteobacteria bacterium]
MPLNPARRRAKLALAAMEAGATGPSDASRPREAYLKSPTASLSRRESPASKGAPPSKGRARSAPGEPGTGPSVTSAASKNPVSSSGEGEGGALRE